MHFVFGTGPVRIIDVYGYGEIFPQEFLILAHSFEGTATSTCDKSRMSPIVWTSHFCESLVACRDQILVPGSCAIRGTSPCDQIKVNQSQIGISSHNSLRTLFKDGGGSRRGRRCWCLWETLREYSPLFGSVLVISRSVTKRYFLFVSGLNQKNSSTE